MYINGTGVRQNNKIAKELFDKSCNMGFQGGSSQSFAGISGGKLAGETFAC